ncbi:MAG TPA: cupredoxin domain-containing protein [Kofleriaceae bacterium]
MSLLIPLSVLSACNKAKKDENAAKPAATETKKSTDASRFDITVTEKGFEPNETNVPAGKPVTLVFERKTDQTCVKQVILTMDDGKKIEKELPLNTPVEIAATFGKPGKLGYVCGMDMMKGTIVVQ